MRLKSILKYITFPLPLYRLRTSRKTRCAECNQYFESCIVHLRTNETAAAWFCVFLEGMKCSEAEQVIYLFIDLSPSGLTVPLFFTYTHIYSMYCMYKNLIFACLACLLLFRSGLYLLTSINLLQLGYLTWFMITGSISGFPSWYNIMSQWQFSFQRFSPQPSTPSTPLLVKLHHNKFKAAPNIANHTAWSKPEGNAPPIKWGMYVHKPPRKATLACTDKKNEEMIWSNVHEEHYSFPNATCNAITRLPISCQAPKCS